MIGLLHEGNSMTAQPEFVQGMTRTKNRIHAVLHAKRIRPFAGKLFMPPLAERAVVSQHLPLAFNRER